MAALTIPLQSLAACFEGVVPSIIATSAADGTPNISYLSHVMLAGDEHVALSNQFFSKTMANVRANPNAALLIVDPHRGAQYRLDVRFERSIGGGELFEEMAIQLQATSTQLGMASVMRLREVDLYRVEAVREVPSPGLVVETAAIVDHGRDLAEARTIVRSIAEAVDLEMLVDTVLDALRHAYPTSSVMLLAKDPHGDRLVTLGSRGYARSGIGSEVAFGQGVIGTAASERRPVRVSDMSRMRRMGFAVQASSDEENRTRTIVLPSMAEAMSQVALPMIARGLVRGVLFLEDAGRLAFSREDEALLAVVATQAAAALALVEDEACEGQPASASTEVKQRPSHASRVVHYGYDDSVFIDGEYLIKGVAGRLLIHLLGLHLRDGRTEFTNREIRLSDWLRLPDFKDNLETRLLLLRRRLEEKRAPIQLVRTGRGRIRLELAGQVILDATTG